MGGLPSSPNHDRGILILTILNLPPFAKLTNYVSRSYRIQTFDLFRETLEMMMPMSLTLLMSGFYRVCHGFRLTKRDD